MNSADKDYELSEIHRTQITGIVFVVGDTVGVVDGEI